MTDIPGFEELYAIEKDGKVFGYKANRYLAQHIGATGYYQVNLNKDGIQFSKKVHRLLALTFIPNPDNKPCIDHINRNRLDNRIENLRWATKQENNQNCSLNKNNKLKEQNICYCKTNKKYIFQKERNGVKDKKQFDTLQEAIDYRDKSSN
jgi:hypothetical protein